MSARIRFRPRITNKKHVFFLPSARVELLAIFEKKTFILADKEIFRKKKQVHFREEFFSSHVFFCLFFSSPSLTLFKIGLNCLYFVALITFSRNLSNVFFIRYFPKIGGMFFSKCFFFTAPLIRSWIFF